jgi:hypothetical protein
MYIVHISLQSPSGCAHLFAAKAACLDKNIAAAITDISYTAFWHVTIQTLVIIKAATAVKD